jgi:YXWGXW repeat-containing protein
MKRKFCTVALAALLFVGLSHTSSFAQVGISIGIAPPPIPIYTQPYPPGPGYIWTPGYWAYDSGYYWVPGAWVLPPRIGFLWTPGYWAYNGSNYFFNQGYWGPTVGFYGGINYGWGYGGHGYYGGRWEGSTFRYNRAVTRVNTTVIHNTYVNREVVRNTGNRASFNGPGGTTAKPTAQQQAAAKAEHIPATVAQTSRLEAAKNNPDLHVANNQGKPKAEAIKAFDRNNGGEAQAGAGNEKGKVGRETTNAGQEATNANFASGRKQVSATGSTTGAKNNAHGKGQSSAGAQTSKKATLSSNAEHTKSKKHTNEVATSHYTPRHAQVTPHRSQQAMIRQSGPTSGKGKAQTAQSNKKKKSKNEGQGGGY